MGRLVEAAEASVWLGGSALQSSSSRRQSSRTVIRCLPFPSLEKTPTEQDVPLNWSEKMDNKAQSVPGFAENVLLTKRHSRGGLRDL